MNPVDGQKLPKYVLSLLPSPSILTMSSFLPSFLCIPPSLAMPIPRLLPLLLPHHTQQEAQTPRPQPPPIHPYRPNLRARLQNVPRPRGDGEET